jgi:hypothetical protein
VRVRHLIDRCVGHVIAVEVVTRDSEKEESRVELWWAVAGDGRATSPHLSGE